MCHQAFFGLFVYVQDLFRRNLYGEPRLLVGIEPNAVPDDLQRRFSFSTSLGTDNEHGASSG
jgi:hypothetical protein